MKLRELNKEKLIKEIEEYVLENYGKFQEFGDNASHYAFCKYMWIVLDTEYDVIDVGNYFKYEIYPQIKKDLNIDDNNRIIQ